MKTTALMFFVIIGFLFAGCVQEGPMGPEGLPGRDGNANVYYSNWYEPTGWSGKTGDWYFGVNDSRITEDIVEYGAILAYMSIPNDIYPNAVRPMPAFANDANWEYIIPDYGKIEFMTDADYVPGTKGYLFRFVLIPSNIQLKTQGIKTTVEALAKMPYEEVCNTLRIPE